MRSYNIALALDLEDVKTIQRSAVAYYKYGFAEKAIARMKLAARIAPTDMSVIFFKLLLHLAVSYESDDHLQKSREAVVKELDVIHDEVTKALAMPGYATQSFAEDGWETLFLLAYQGKNDKDIMQRYSAELARALRPFFPKNISDELPPKRPARRSGKIRVGFCTAFFYHHSVWKIPLHGFYKYIDRAKFEIHSFHMGGTKEQFGLSESDLVFFSPQSLFKYLPENDDIYPEIAGRIDNAKFVFIASAAQEGRKEFEARLRFAFERRGLDFDRHVAFIPGQGKTGFMQACNMADLFIDNPSWSGHNTVLDALHSRTPVVSMRGDAMRKNHGAAILCRLGLDELVANSKEALIEKCIFFGKSRESRVAFEEIIERRSARFQDRSPVEALMSFFDSVSQAVR